MAYPSRSQLAAALWTVLGLLTAVSVVCFAFPAFVIRPFRGQTPQEMLLALHVKSAGPVVSGLAALAILPVVFLLIPKVSALWQRVLALSLAGLAIAGAAGTRVNLFEIMFHRMARVEFVRADQAKVDGDDMVLALTLRGDAHAYPIRTIGYHHVINDWVGEAPVVATY